jgi:hypothetical protein
MPHEEELEIKFRGEDEVIINNNTVIKSKPLATFLRHALKFYLGPRGGIGVSRDYYDERVTSYIVSRDGEETSVYIGDTGVEVDGVEVKSELLASLLKHILNAFIMCDGEGTVEIWRRGRKYIIKATTPCG